MWSKKKISSILTDIIYLCISVFRTQIFNFVAINFQFKLKVWHAVLYYRILFITVTI